MYLIDDAPEVLEFVNHNLKDIITPVNVKKFESLLREANYDPAKTKFLVEGFWLRKVSHYNTRVL